MLVINQAVDTYGVHWLTEALVNLKFNSSAIIAYTYFEISIIMIEARIKAGTRATTASSDKTCNTA